jgi:hypothetical protein
VTYTGTWRSWNDTKDFHGSERYTTRAGDSAEHTFTGTSVQYVSMTQPNMGKVDVYIDGTLARSDIDAYSPSVTKQAVLFRKTDLSAGPHTIKVVCKGTKNAASSNTVCALDAFSSVAFPAQGAYYKILNRNSGLSVDVASGSTSDGARVVQWGYNNVANQHWRFESAGSGAFEISSQKSGKLIDVDRASTADNATVLQWADNDGANQRWQLVDAGNGYSKLRNVNSGKVLAVSGSSTAAGAQIVQVTDTGANSQQWQIIRVN